MSEALFNYYSDGRYTGISAGSNPSDKINPVVVDALKEINIDISDKKPKKLTKEILLEADLTVTMGCREDACPITPNELREWNIEDPHGKSIEEIKKIRDDLIKRINELIKELNGNASKIL